MIPACALAGGRAVLATAGGAVHAGAHAARQRSEAPASAVLHGARTSACACPLGDQHFIAEAPLNQARRGTPCRSCILLDGAIVPPF